MKSFFQYKIIKSLILSFIYFLFFNISIIFFSYILPVNVSLADLKIDFFSIKGISLHIISFSYISILLFYDIKISRSFFIILNTLFSFIYSIVFFYFYFSFEYGHTLWGNGWVSWFFATFGETLQFWSLYLWVFILSFSKKFRVYFFNK